jgi:hypothetical protein
MRRTAAVLLATAALLALASCGDDDSGGSGGDSQSADGQEYVDAIMSTFDAEDAGFPEEDAQCVAERTVDIVGVDTLQEAGITPEEIAAGDGEDLLADFEPTEEQADAIVDGFFECVDFAELFVGQMTMTTDVQIDEEKLRCIGERMQSSEALRASLKASVLGDESTDDPFSEDAIFTMFEECDVELTDLMPSS